MPIYEYGCSNCGKITEALQKFSDPPLTKCEYCKGEVSKLISRSSFHLKGSGWYVTDYSGKTQSNTDHTPKKTDDSPKKESKSDTSTTTE